jgi:hypothetical protein
MHAEYILSHDVTISVAVKEGAYYKESGARGKGAIRVRQAGLTGAFEFVA